MPPDSPSLSRPFWSALSPFTEGVDYRVLEDGCWDWLRARNSAGYGCCQKTHGQRLAHRAA